LSCCPFSIDHCIVCLSLRILIIPLVNGDEVIMKGKNNYPQTTHRKLKIEQQTPTPQKKRNGGELR
jgi:hypothetical protein